MRASRLLLLAALGLAACATGPSTPPAAPAPRIAAVDPPAPPGRLPPQPTGYLSQSSFDLMQVLPAAPQSGDARDEADRRIFRETRALEGSARWAMASDDANLGADAMLDHFACSLGVALTREQAPRLVQVLQRATSDAAAAMLAAKDFYKRQRPFHIDAGPICRPRAELGNSFDYPSGHSTAGFMWGLVLAEMEPDRATRILARGRSIGESRVACGVHNASAVEGGRFTATVVFATISALPEYRKDFEAGHEELEHLRAAHVAEPEAARCEAERALVDAPLIPAQRR